ncbi:MAG: selenocysteine-specific translation elongation factor [Burkholderiales bacterium]|nr:selenocysteine-specific translation elongation factor [Burkholderiales bacterium]
MIIGTAGHIDHGKTTLVRALTGVDTDRLPEEKARGISIELGYAFLDVPGQPEARVGFIDVPGHERLVHTMLAGATGIDLALLLVAADDGVMPQTREHLAVLSLLGIARGALVITKCDRADAARIAQVQAEVFSLLAPTPLAGTPVFEVSAVSGDGVDALRCWLLQQQAALPGVAQAPAPDAFRLAVDRVFTLGGAGTVATGTVFAGAVRVGDELVLAPAAGSGARLLDDAPRLRVRSLHAQNRQVDQALAGQRCAVALAGIAKEAVQRGQWLCAPALALQTDRLDVRLTLWHDESRALRSGASVHVHIGSAQAMGTVAVLAAADGNAAADQLAPGQSGLVQLVLRTPVGAWAGDRVVLRDAAASRTLAGGVVLDPFAPARYRRTPQRLAELAAAALPEPASRLLAWLDACPLGLDLKRHAAAQASPVPPLPVDVLQAREGSGHWALAARHGQAVEQAVLAGLQAFHASHPEEMGPDAARLRRLAAPRLHEALWRALLDRLRSSGQVQVKGAFVHLPEHGVRLTAVDERLAQKLGPLLDAAGFEGAWVRDLARDMKESEPLTRVTMARLAQGGELHQVVRDLYYPVPTVQRLVALASQVGAQAAEPGQVTAAAFRDATGLGRKRAIQILEYFDRIGLLRRVGDVHKLRADSALLTEPGSAA